MGMFCASVPALKPLLLKYAPRALGSRVSDSHGQQGEDRLFNSMRLDLQFAGKSEFRSDVELGEHGCDSGVDMDSKPTEARRAFV